MSGHGLDLLLHVTLTSIFMPSLETPDTCRRLITALHYQRPLITKEMEVLLEQSNNFVTKSIPNKGVVAQYDNSDSIEFREAFQPFTAFREIASGPGDKISGSMPARACDGNRALIAADVDPYDPNACHGVRTWNFAHGHAEKTTQDYRDAYESDVICIENYAQHGPDRVKAMFRALRRSFSRHGVDNYEAYLRYLVIKHGEANASVVGSANHFSVSTNGWEAPPEHLMSIPYLERYRQYMIGVEKSTVKNELGVLTVEMPRRDWFAAVAEDILRTNGPQVSLTAMQYEDPRAPFYGREYHQYKNIKCIFNEEPEKGYFKANGVSGGKTLWTFVPVYPQKNVAATELPGASGGAGIAATRNEDYWKDYIVCDGVRYQMVSLAYVLNPAAFELYNISPTMGPEGVKPIGTNFEVNLVTGPYITCNDKNNKFKLLSEKKFRFKVLEPQLAGAIVYIPEPQGIAYVRDACADTSADTTTDEPSTYRPLSEPIASACETATCVDCFGNVVDPSDGSCVSNADGTFEMEPCPVAEVVYNGGTHNLVLKVWRAGNLTDAATVDYAVAAVTAVAGTHFTDPANATLSWAAGEGGYKEITVPILAAHATDDVTFTVTISNATGGASIGDCSVTTVTILGED